MREASIQSFSAGQDLASIFKSKFPRATELSVPGPVALFAVAQDFKYFETRPGAGLLDRQSTRFNELVSAKQRGLLEQIEFLQYLFEPSVECVESFVDRELIGGIFFAHSHNSHVGQPSHERIPPG